MLPKTESLTGRHSVARALLAGAAFLTLAPQAAADDTSECIAASEAAQSLRDQHSLLAARDKLSVCVRDVCPGPVRVDCLRLRADVDAATPSVVLRARTAHGDDSDVQVFDDGVPFATRLDGKAVPVDPGPHAFRFQSADLPPVERSVVVAEGEKNRLLVVDIGVPARPTEPAAPPASARSADHAGRDLRTIAGWVAGGVGVAATIPMAALWLSGTSDVHQMRDTCAPSAGGAGCPSSRIDSDRTRLVVGDVLMGVAVAGIASGALLLFVHPPEHKTLSTLGALDLRVGASPAPGGGFIWAAARF
jgi:hypothetical protein